MVAGYLIDDRIIEKSSKEIYVIKDFTNKNKCVLSSNLHNEDDDFEISFLALQANYRKITFAKGDLIESDVILAKFDKFSTYSTDIAVCEWVFNKRLNEYMDDSINEVCMSYFNKVQKGVGLEINASGKLEKKEYDYINPNHYKSGSIETIDMMIRIWGVEKVISHCEITAFKYRMRAGKKPEQSIQRDLEKAKWYEEKAKELQNELCKKEK